MLGQNVGQQPPSSMYQQQQGPPQGTKPTNPPFYPGGNPQRQPRFPTGQMNQGTPQQGMYNLPTVMYIPNAGQFGPNQQVLVNPGMIQQPRMNTPQFNPGMALSQTGMYQMPQQQPQYTQGCNNPPTYYNTQQQQSQRTPSGGAPMNPNKQKERKTGFKL